MGNNKHSSTSADNTTPVNQSNLLSPVLQYAKLGSDSHNRLRYQGIIDKNVEVVSALLRAVVSEDIDVNNIAEQAIESGPSLCYYAVFNDVPCGAICVRNVPSDGSHSRAGLQVFCFAVLPAYRNLGIGRSMLSKLLDIHRENAKKTEDIYVDLRTGACGDLRSFLEHMAFESVTDGTEAEAAAGVSFKTTAKALQERLDTKKNENSN